MPFVSFLRPSGLQCYLCQIGSERHNVTCLSVGPSLTRGTLFRLIIKMTVIFQNDRYLVPKWPLFFTKMTVVWPKWPLILWPKWPLVHHQNDRCMTKMTDIFDQNDRYQNDRCQPKWPLSITKMTVIHQFQKKITLILVLNDQNDRYLKSEIIGHFG